MDRSQYTNMINSANRNPEIKIILDKILGFVVRSAQSKFNGDIAVEVMSGKITGVREHKHNSLNIRPF